MLIVVLFVVAISHYFHYLKLLSFYAQSCICEMTGADLSLSINYAIIFVIVIEKVFRNGWANRQRKKFFKDFMGLIYILSVMIHKSNEVT